MTTPTDPGRAAAREDHSNDMPQEPRDSIAILLDQVCGMCVHWTDLRPDADDFIAGLAQRGYTLVPTDAASAAAGSVTISREVAKHAIAALLASWVDETQANRPDVGKWKSAIDEIYAAIAAAASAGAGGEGE